MKSFNQKHECYVGNLDNAYDALLEAREREIFQDEIIRDWLLTDTNLFGRLARQWLEDPVNREGFLSWAIDQVKAERTPAHTRAWRKDPLEVTP